MRKTIRWGSAAAIVGAFAIQFVRPPRTNPVTIPERTLAARVPLTSEAAAILDRSCRDCHSNDTRWPWYSNVAPVSWFVIDHVDHGRRHLNYSDWAQYSPDDVQRLLKNICAFAKKDTMPLSSYLRMHRDARLSDADVTTLCDWTDSVLRPLNGGGLRWKMEDGTW
jgi:Haem-binding domain